jgi:hypothetical protein
MFNTLQYGMANTLQNWDLRRPYTARLDERVQGFTEDWGKDSNKNTTTTLDDDDDQLRTFTNHHHQQHQQEQQQSVSPTTDDEFPKCSLRLFQYRPAWFEQLVLRVSHVAHVVINAPYAVMEVTGPLPALLDLDGGSSTQSNNHNNGNNHDDNNPPAMMGRYQARSDATTQNAILDYLKLYRGIDLDLIFTNEAQRQQSVTFLTIINDTLTPCLLALRYQADPDAWQQIYRPQCIAAATSGSSSRYWQSRPMLAMWQAWSERVHSISKLRTLQRAQSKDAIIGTVRRIYSILEHQIQMQHSLSKQYLLGTDQPTVVDCLLWDHLMQAMADIHLVIVLADYPGLLQFTQQIWNTYSFGTIITEDGSKHVSSVWVWNLEENSMNAFTAIPLIPRNEQIYGNASDHSTIDIVDKLNTFQTDLHKSLSLAKQRRSETGHQVPIQQSLSTWHRWRMGGGFLPKREMTIDRTASTTSDESSHRKYRRNDEIWMTSVIAVTVIALLGSGLVS